MNFLFSRCELSVILWVTLREVCRVVPTNEEIMIFVEQFCICNGNESDNIHEVELIGCLSIEEGAVVARDDVESSIHTIWLMFGCRGDLSKLCEWCSPLAGYEF